MSEVPRRRVWVDLDNSPHILFFAPIIDALRRVGVRLILTAKPQAQTLELAHLHGLNVTSIGRPNARRRAMKPLVTLQRAAALGSVIRQGPQPALLLSHGSRSGVLAARLLGIPAWTFLDYEHVEARSLALGTAQFWFPDLLASASLRDSLARRASFYPGLKENIYLQDWPLRPAGLRQELGVSADVKWVVSRPPATTAHYASERSWELWRASIGRLAARQEATIHVVPRDRAQREQVKSLFSSDPSVKVLERAVDGPSLIAAADLVVGGGGTMNREAAVLGTPVWSVFNGPTPHIDEQLAREGRLLWIRCADDIGKAERTLWSRPLPRGGGAQGRDLIIGRVLEKLGMASASLGGDPLRRALGGA